jgi:hypothetical protein
MLFRSSDKTWTRNEHCNMNEFRLMEQRKCGHQILTATRIGSWHRGWSSWWATGVSAWSSPITQVDMGTISKLLAQLSCFAFSTARRPQRRPASCYPLSGHSKGAFINSTTCNLYVLLFDKQVHCLQVHSSTLVKKSPPLHHITGV